MKIKNQNKFPPFSDVKAFFQSWGMYPENEISDILANNLNPEVIEQGINRMCWERMREHAGKHIQSSKHPDVFVNFVSRHVEACDDAFYLAVETWAELEEEWEDYTSQLW